MSCILTGFDMIDEITRGINDFACTFDICKKEVLPYSLKLEGVAEAGSDYFEMEYFAKKLVALQMKAYLRCYEGRHWNQLKQYNRRLYKYESGPLAPLTSLYKDLTFYIYQCSEFEKFHEPELLVQLRIFRDKLACYIVETSDEYKNQRCGDSYKETI